MASFSQRDKQRVCSEVDTPLSKVRSGCPRPDLLQQAAHPVHAAVGFPSVFVDKSHTGLLARMLGGSTTRHFSRHGLLRPTAALQKCC